MKRFSQRCKHWLSWAVLAAAPLLGQAQAPSTPGPHDTILMYQSADRETWLLERARRLEVEDQAPTPLVTGRHLLELGMLPGPRLGEILDDCYEAQLDGEFTDADQGIAYARQRLGLSPHR